MYAAIKEGERMLVGLMYSFFSRYIFVTSFLLQINLPSVKSFFFPLSFSLVLRRCNLLALSTLLPSHSLYAHLLLHFNKIKICKEFIKKLERNVTRKKVCVVRSRCSGVAYACKRFQIGCFAPASRLFVDTLYSSKLKC